jgi:hypothetical protein
LWVIRVVSRNEPKGPVHPPTTDIRRWRLKLPNQSRIRGALHHPLEPVIGLAEGETRWRVTTVCRLRAPPYAFRASRNRTGSPLDGVVNSPCHITRLPRTKVPTGHPVTRTPS